MKALDDLKKYLIDITDQYDKKCVSYILGDINFIENKAKTLDQLTERIYSLRADLNSFKRSGIDVLDELIEFINKESE